MAAFRNPAARDRAWGRWYRRLMPWSPTTKSDRPLTAKQRRMEYERRRDALDGDRPATPQHVAFNPYEFRSPNLRKEQPA